MADVADLAIRARTQGVKRSEKEIQGLRGASRRATTAVRALGAGIAALGAGAAIRAIRNNIRQTAQISELADVAGVSAERIQELSKAFSDMAGITESTTTGALRRFNRRLGLAEQGTGAAGDTFDQLGISIQNANGEMRATQPVLDAAIERLTQIENESRRAARASELFGEDAGPQIAAALAQGTEALRDQIRELREQGRILSNETAQGARDANDELNRMSDILSTEFARRVADNAESIEAVASGLMNIAELGLDAAEGIQTFGEALGFMAGRIVAGDIIDTVPEMESRLSDLREELARLESEPGAQAGLPIFTNRIEELEREISGLESRLEMARNSQNNFGEGSNQAALSVRTLKEEVDLLGQAFPEFADGAMDVRTLTQELAKIDEAYETRSFEIAARDLEELRRQANPALDSLLETESVLRRLENALAEGLIDADEFRELANALTVEKPGDETKEAVQSWKDQFRDIQQAANASFSDIGMMLADSMEGASDSTKSAIAAIGGAMGNLKQIMKEGGEDSFQAYKRMAQAEAAIAGALAVQKALASAPPPVNIALAGTIGALTAVQVAAIEQQEYSGRKTGGQVRAGESYMVGENGPEIVTMNGGGHVTPNHQINSGNSSNVTQVFQLSDNARREAKQQILESAPMIRNMAKQAVIEAAQNGGQMSRTVGARS